MILLKNIIKIHKFLLGFSWGCCSYAAPLDEPPLNLIDRMPHEDDRFSLLQVKWKKVFNIGNKLLPDLT